ncbi:DUF1830 domain-containing protein [Waterburya agarophytonicola K14]|uniref:DUF1830 domain-containing protein n=1 Tax=Waterburya agarophytonicola KI4 TaxID=2874699 RepID=A0A964BLW1_9CYAN|nr:DUF1830 domain-containing protein [Waterburya agarophytonicola KI4]
MIIAKINEIENRQCKRVVFPTEKFLLMADNDCKLEIQFVSVRDRSGTNSRLYCLLRS